MKQRVVKAQNATLPSAAQIHTWIAAEAEVLARVGAGERASA